MIKINKNLVIFSGLLLLLTVMVIRAVNKFSPLIGHAAYYCQSLITTHVFPIPSYISNIPVIFLFLIVMISFIKYIVLLYKIRLFKFTLRDNATINDPIMRRIKRLGLKNKTIVAQSNENFAFCLGIWKPKIYISTGLVAQLSLKETEAVLRHEQYHIEHHDTVTMIIASLSHSLFPFFPILGDLITKYRIDREIAADRFAVAHVGNRRPLIRALKKLLICNTITSVALPAIADYDTLEPRIYSLINKRYSKRQFRLRHLLITTISSFIIGIIMIVPVYSKEVHHNNHDVILLCAQGSECMSACASEKNLHKLYSEIPQTQKMSRINFLQSSTPD